ncbi:MAG: NAD(P)/FAD-dependent oxidoreductase [Candidatus Ranarchaeia archaeon]
MNNKTDVVIIGAGSNGLFTAYWLEKFGIKNVTVIDKTHLVAGATARCAGGIRGQWATEENIVLARKSQKLFEKMNDALDWNILFRQGGYLILAHDEDEVKQFRKNITLQNKLDVPSKLISVDEAVKKVPELNPNSFISATFCKKDGIAHPFAVLEGLHHHLKKKGINVKLYTKALDIETKDEKIKKVITDKGEIITSTVVVAAGAYSKPIIEKLGIEIPTYPHRREIMVSESYKPVLNPMVVSLKIGFYLSQTMRGELLGGMGDPNEPKSFNTESSSTFLEQYSKKMCYLLPGFKDLRVQRQWAGLYDISPDAKPILGKTEDLDGLIMCSGFSGHGFMLSPIVGKLLAELIVYDKPSLPLDTYDLKRFKGKIGEEKSVV